MGHLQTRNLELIPYTIHDIDGGEGLHMGGVGGLYSHDMAR
jgi:hypothetical protein